MIEIVQPDEIADRASVLETLKRLDVSVFDGHTEFSRLNVEERLIWLSQIAFFVCEFCGIVLRSEM